MALTQKVLCSKGDLLCWPHDGTRHGHHAVTRVAWHCLSAFLAHGECLHRRGAALSASRALGINGRGEQTKWNFATALQAAYQQVDGLVRLLHSADPSRDVCNLALCKGGYIMPTLNGWLLGYPVVYLVDEATVQATADHLSSEGVQRHIVLISSPGLKVLLWTLPAGAR